MQQKKAQKQVVKDKKPVNQKAAKPVKPVKEVKEVKAVKEAKKKATKMEVEESTEDFDQIEEGLDEEVPEGGENVEALAAILKSNNETKAKKKEKTKKILDFKFRTLELIQIFLKRTKNPSIFLQYVAPLVISLRESEKDKAKDALVNKISALLKSYIDRQQSFPLNYSKELEDCVAEVLHSARRVKNKKVQKVYKYLLKCILAIVFKAGLKTPVAGLVDRYQEALSDYVTKKSTELDAEYFKELVSKHKVIGVELLETLIQGANVKTCGGPKSDLVREECLNMLVSLVQSSGGNSEYLITKIIQHEAKVGDLMINTLENIEQIKNKKFAILQKYYNLFKLILNMLSNIKTQESVDEVLKQKAGALISPYKNRITKRLKALEESEMAKTNPNFTKKLESMIEEVKTIN